VEEGCNSKFNLPKISIYVLVDNILYDNKMK